MATKTFSPTCVFPLQLLRANSPTGAARIGSTPDPAKLLGVRRWLFNLAAAMSLVMCVASAALAARSFFACDTLGRTHFDLARQLLIREVVVGWSGKVVYIRQDIPYQASV